MHLVTLVAWTEPPTPCPYKYQKLLKAKGPLTTDEEFFAELQTQEKSKHYPSGRGNLSFKLQHYLLDVEADFFRMTEEAGRLTNEVGRIAKEILEPAPKCDACCSCRQTKKTHLKWHATKAPHVLIEHVVPDEEADGKKCRQGEGGTGR